MSTLCRDLERILGEHTLGFIGSCVTVKGLPGCAWKPRRDVVRHGGFGTQHRHHQAELLAASVSPVAAVHRAVPATEQAVLA